MLILNGTYQAATGKLMMRVEAPGGYAERFMLAKLGCENVGDSFKPANGKANKGHYPVKKKKGNLLLNPMIEANPDVIVMLGDPFAVQMAIAGAVKTNPALAAVPAVRNHALYSLPGYYDSSVIEYPGILKRWAHALTQ